MPNQGNGYDSRCLTSFIKAEEMVNQFEKNLASLGINVKNGSDLETICLNIMDLEPKRQGLSNIDPQSDSRPLWRRTVGLVDLLRLLKYAAGIGKLHLFEPHLRLLNEGTSSQNSRVFSDEVCNKIFEMHVALFCLPLAETLKLDDPCKSSKVKNPDVLATIDGTIWGFECKTPNGNAAMTMFENMKRGVEQIEASPAQRGAVYFNFRNVIDHDVTWPAIIQKPGSSDESKFQIWPNAKPVEAILESLVNEKHAGMLHEVGSDNVKKLFMDNKKSIPGAMVFLQTAAAFRSKCGPFPATTGIVAFMQFDSIPDSEKRLLQRIQDARRDVLVL